MTVVEAVLQLLTRVTSARLLVATPSNSAADLLTQRLHDSGQVQPGVMARLNAYQRSEQVRHASLSRVFNFTSCTFLW